MLEVHEVDAEVGVEGPFDGPVDNGDNGLAGDGDSGAEDVAAKRVLVCVADVRMEMDVGFAVFGGDVAGEFFALVNADDDLVLEPSVFHAGMQGGSLQITLLVVFPCVFSGW